MKFLAVLYLKFDLGNYAWSNVEVVFPAPQPTVDQIHEVEHQVATRQGAFGAVLTNLIPLGDV